MNNHQYECILTLAMPVKIEEAVVEHLQAHPEWVSGFSVTRAEGFGSGAPLNTMFEQVKGRASRCLVTLLMSHANAQELLQSLRMEFRNPHVAYWITPVIEFGRFA